MLREQLPFVYELYIETVLKEKGSPILREQLPSLYEVSIEAVLKKESPILREQLSFLYDSHVEAAQKRKRPHSEGIAFLIIIVYRSCTEKKEATF